MTTQMFCLANKLIPLSLPLGMLFAVGGYDGASRQCLSSVECYNPMTDMWSPVAEMSCRRSGAGTYPASLLTSTFYEHF